VPAPKAGEVLIRIAVAEVSRAALSDGIEHAYRKSCSSRERAGRPAGNPPGKRR
jgi:hypothetical protein